MSRETQEQIRWYHQVIDVCWIGCMIGCYRWLGDPPDNVWARIALGVGALVSFCAVRQFARKQGRIDAKSHHPKGE